MGIIPYAIGVIRYLFILSMLATALSAQTTLFVSGASSSWTSITSTETPNNTLLMTDILGDRQTGQTPDDFIGAGFFVDTGTINGIASIGFRTYMAGYTASGYSGNLRIGIDGNRDGVVDLFLGPKLSGNAGSQGIVFQDATGAGNYSPSTTALGNPYGRIAFTADNYNYQPIAPVLDPLWGAQGVTVNSAISFTVSTQTLKDAFAALGITLTDQSYMSFLAFTSTQANAINQDLYGPAGISNTTRFDGPSGGFSDYYALDGSFAPRPIIPEPWVYGAGFMAFSLIFVGWSRWSSRRASTC